MNLIKRLSSIFSVLLFFLVVLFSFNLSYLGNCGKSWIIAYMEKSLSNETHKIKITGVTGLLTSTAFVKKIAISDKQGKWAQLDDIVISWSRSSLLFYKTLKIHKLKADKIEIFRRPASDFENPFKNFSLDKIPLDININKLEVKKIQLHAALSKKPADLNLNGDLHFIAKNLDINAKLKRIDKPGNINLKASYTNQSQIANLQLKIAEPKDGVLVNILQLAKKPSFDAEISAKGSLADLTLTITAKLDQNQVLSGILAINQPNVIDNSNSNNRGHHINLALSGSFDKLLPSNYISLFPGTTNIRLDTDISANNPIFLNEIYINNSILNLAGDAQLAADMFPTKLKLKGTIDSKVKTIINVNNNKIELKDADIAINYGDENSDKWFAIINSHHIRYNNNAAFDLALNFTGYAKNLNQPTSRSISFTGTSQMQRYNDVLQMSSSGQYNALNIYPGYKINISDLLIQHREDYIRLFGSITKQQINASTSINIKNLSQFGKFFNQKVTGSINLSSLSHLDLSDSTNPILKQSLAGNCNNFNFPTLPDNLKKLLASKVNIDSKFEYNFGRDHSLKLYNSYVSAPSIHAKSNGYISKNAADLRISIDKIDLSLIKPELGGYASGNFTAEGENGTINIRGDANSSVVYFNNEPLHQAQAEAALIYSQGSLNGNMKIVGKDRPKGENISLVVERSKDKVWNFIAEKLPSKFIEPFFNLNFLPVKITGQASLNDKQIDISHIAIEQKLDEQYLKGNFTGQYNYATKDIKGDIDLNLPISIANRFLMKNNINISGQLKTHTQIAGSILNPIINGQAEFSKGGFFDANNNIQLQDINGTIEIKDSIAQCRSFTAKFEDGGRASINGSIDLHQLLHPIANLNLDIDNAHYKQSSKFSATGSGNLTIKGDVLTQPEISGAITINQGQILITKNSESLTPMIVEHKRSNKSILTTLERANAGNKASDVNKKTTTMLNITISSPGKLYVKGMGVDVEMSGDVQLRGVANNLHPTGLFKILRGKFDLFSHQLTFQEGSITLDGELRPYLNFISKTQIDNFAIEAKVTGPIDNIHLAFNSSPPLPQDEILAYILFNRSLKQLSPFQIAQIATTLSNFSGGENILSDVEAIVKLDDINIDSDKDNNIGINAGKYITKNIYTTIGATEKGTTKAGITWNLHKNIKVQGQYSSDNQNNLGIYYSKDY